jgi:hypothetical protein
MLFSFFQLTSTNNFMESKKQEQTTAASDNVEVGVKPGEVERLSSYAGP